MNKTSKKFHNASGKFSNNDYIINDEPMSDEFINDFLSERKKSQPSESSIPDITKISPSTVMPTQNNIINNKYYNNISINQAIKIHIDAKKWIRLIRLINKRLLKK